eukprot:TRINITY_DN2369_c0_g1_i1.p1 TRINITY_DN2369_c0_g1~~TRINITY_DN2369_c0_g1_i1.p1  ORF type:complete len:296 (-),score=47.59 TRINITY_DN2369_c0_g1_i1:889-1776(-)
MALNSDCFLVLPSPDFHRIIHQIDENISSCAYYLAGPYATGKTNTLWQVQLQAQKKGYLTTFIDGDFFSGEDKWKIMRDGLMALDFVKNAINLTPEMTVRQQLEACTQTFKHAPSCKIVVCIDESQNFLTLDGNFWNQRIRELVRHHDGVFVICATSHFDFFRPVTNLESPFSKEFFSLNFFTQDDIQKAISLLQGKGMYFIDLSTIMQPTSEKIFRETEGHLGLCAHYFVIIRNIAELASRSSYQLQNTDILEQWEYQSEVTILEELKTFRRFTRLREEKDSFNTVESVWCLIW